MMCVIGVWVLPVAIMGEIHGVDCEELLESAKHGRKQVSTGAFKALLELANKDTVRAQFHVAECYEQGWGTTASADKATEWYDAAAAGGHPVARIRVAGRNLMEAPNGQTMGSVLDVLKDAGDRGHPQARVLLALATEWGLVASGGANPSFEAKRLRRFAFLLRYSGRRPFIEIMTLQYSGGQRLFREKSIDDYRAASAGGSVFASLEVAGRHDEQGKSKEALRTLQSAAATAGAMELILISAYCRVVGGRALPGRIELADRAVTESVAVLAIRVGRRDPDAARLLALFYGGGAWTQLDDKERSRTWLEIEASMRRPLAVRGDVESQYRLARLMELGIAKSIDGETATQWFRQAAEHGHAHAQLRLGRLLEKEGKRPESIEWIESARKQGVDDTSRALSMYE